ncbi:SulP family inorganic anion transporter [Brachybacterium sp. DNPG3]
MNSPHAAEAPVRSVTEALRRPRALTTEVLAGAVTTLALIPEVISFSVIAGVDPKVSLVASVVLAISMSILGGRPAMITAAAGAVALVVAPLVAEHGVEYLLPTVILAGIVQILFGVLGLARIMRFIPRSVMIGFVNSLGILIFTAQLQHVLDVPAAVYPLFALTLVIVIGLPRFTRAVPAPLIAIVLVTAIAMIGGLDVPDVGDQGEIAGGLPGLTQLQVPLSVETLRIIAPTALSVAFVGLMETLLTAKLVDDITDTRSSKSRESWALGVANILAGCWGGIAGCAMIGQTVVNVKLGRARTRISTFIAGALLLLLVTVLSDLMARIPMAALAAVMMVVAVSTADFHSIRPSTLRRMPLSETCVMVVTVVVVVATHNLAIGVGTGAILAMVLFARRVAHVTTVRRSVVPAPSDGAAIDGAAPEVRYTVRGPLFFGSSNDLVEQFSYAEDAETVGADRTDGTDGADGADAPGGSVLVDFSAAQIWDASTVAVLDAVQTKYAEHGLDVRFAGLDEISARFHGRLTGTLG